MDTIFALATAPGRAGVSVIRISGPQAFAVAQALSGRSLPDRGMVFTELTDQAGGHLDDVLVLSFTGPASFTGEDCVELQMHGSPAVVSAVSAALIATGVCRLAEPGEFTRRALENGKLDLAQVEGLADLIDADTEIQRQQAQRVLSGHIGRQVELWRADLVRAASLIEVTIDFADEDVPVDVTPEVRTLLEDVRQSLLTEGAKTERAERIRQGFEVAIVGEPNAGKSTLLNYLSGREAAITSDIAGTTRDVVEVRMDLDGLPVTLLDTAGIRETQDQIEEVGVRRAQERAELADLRVFLSESPEELGVQRWPEDICVRPKADVLGEQAAAVSGVTGVGVDALVRKIVAVLSDRVPTDALTIRARHGEAMRGAAESLEAALETLKQGSFGYDIAAEDIRTAIRRLERLVGKIDVENLLDEIFSSFCLGK